MPVAVNFWFKPTKILDDAGVTVMETSSGGVILTMAISEVMPENLAVISVVPCEREENSPFVPDTLLIVPIRAFEELQLTRLVRSFVDRSVKVPVAANCWLAVAGTFAVGGVTAMEDKVAPVMVVLPEIFPEVAVMVAEPAARAVTSPFASTVATDVFDEFQVTCVVISWVDPSA